MRELGKWFLSISDTIFVYIGVFSLAGTLVFILHLLGIDVLGLSKYCDLAFTKTRIMLCKAKESSLVKIMVSAFIIIFWYVFYNRFRKHNDKYQNIDK